MSSARNIRITLAVACLTMIGGCASVPPQVAQLHQKERDILVSLQESHLAMVDAYVDERIQRFEAFFFGEYGPAYLKNWRTNFKDFYGRDYDEERDFEVLYSDLVAEYQDEIAPLSEMRKTLRDAIATEYRNALEAHDATNAWLDSLEKLNTAQKQTMDRLLGSLKPGFTTDDIERMVDDAITRTRGRLAEITD